MLSPLANILPTVFVFMSVWWFILIGVVSLVVLWVLSWELLEDESRQGHPYAVTTAILGVTFLLWLTLGDAHSTLRYFFHEQSFGQIALTFGKYIALGCVWMCFRWWRKNKLRLDRLQDKQAAWLKDRGVTTGMTEALKPDWKKYVLSGDAGSEFVARRPGYGYKAGDSEAEKNQLRLVLDWRDYKSSLTAWLFYWPWSMLQYFLFDFLTAIGNRIIRSFGFILNWISAQVFRRAVQDLNA
jgi:hypothetical protein